MSYSDNIASPPRSVSHRSAGADTGRMERRAAAARVSFHLPPRPSYFLMPRDGEEKKGPSLVLYCYTHQTICDWYSGLHEEAVRRHAC